MSLEGFSLRQGATDSEKRVQHLTLENEALKQSLSLTRDLLLHWGPGPSTRAPQVFSLVVPFLQSGAPEHLAPCNTAQDLMLWNPLRPFRARAQGDR